MLGAATRPRDGLHDLRRGGTARRDAVEALLEPGVDLVHGACTPVAGVEDRAVCRCRFRQEIRTRPRAVGIARAKELPCPVRPEEMREIEIRRRRLAAERPAQVVLALLRVFGRHRGGESRIVAHLQDPGTRLGIGDARRATGADPDRRGLGRHAVARAVLAHHGKPCPLEELVEAGGRRGRGLRTRVEAALGLRLLDQEIEGDTRPACRDLDRVANLGSGLWAYRSNACHGGSLGPLCLRIMNARMPGPPPRQRFRDRGPRMRRG